MKPLNCFNPRRFHVEPFDNDLVKPMIVENHYLKRWPANAQNCFGVIHDKSRLVGALVFGGPVRRDLSKSISPCVKNEEIAELLRVWIEDGPFTDGFGTGLESWAIAQAFKMLPTGKLLVVSYADPSAGHTGKIYQALNGLYQVVPHSFATYQVNYTDPNDPNGWITSRSQQRIFGRHDDQSIKRKLNKTFWKRRDAHKYRYLWILEKKRRKAIEETLYYPRSPYPKETVQAPAIEEITVTE